MKFDDMYNEFYAAYHSELDNDALITISPSMQAVEIDGWFTVEELHRLGVLLAKFHSKHGLDRIEID